MILLAVSLAVPGGSLDPHTANLEEASEGGVAECDSVTIMRPDFYNLSSMSSLSSRLKCREGGNSLES